MKKSKDKRIKRKIKIQILFVEKTKNYTSDKIRRHEKIKSNRNVLIISRLIFNRLSEFLAIANSINERRNQSVYSMNYN